MASVAYFVLCFLSIRLSHLVAAIYLDFESPMAVDSNNTTRKRFDPANSNGRFQNEMIEFKNYSSLTVANVVSRLFVVFYSYFIVLY